MNLQSRSTWYWSTESDKKSLERPSYCGDIRSVKMYKSVLRSRLICSISRIQLNSKAAGGRTHCIVVSSSAVGCGALNRSPPLGPLTHDQDNHGNHGNDGHPRSNGNRDNTIAATAPIRRRRLFSRGECWRCCGRSNDRLGPAKVPWDSRDSALPQVLPALTGATALFDPHQLWVVRDLPSTRTL